MWGTDATRFYTEREGWCWFFGAIDHGIDEVLGWHVAKRGDRWAALEPIRQGVRHAFGAFRKDIARGLAIRCDWGPQYIADAWINEVKWLGITISPSYVGEPECKGVIARFNSPRGMAVDSSGKIYVGDVGNHTIRVGTP
jgi:putative transposase